MHGGEDTPYVDPTDCKKKVITLFDISSLRFETMVNGRKVYMDGNQVAFHAKYFPRSIRIKAEINDVFIVIDPKTTVEGAMKQLYKKLHRQNVKVVGASSRQRD